MSIERYISIPWGELLIRIFNLGEAKFDTKFSTLHKTLNFGCQKIDFRCRQLCAVGNSRARNIHEQVDWAEGGEPIDGRAEEKNRTPDK